VIALRRLAAQRREHAEAGVTVLEMLVAVAVFSVVIALISNLYVSTTRALTVAQTTNQNTRQVSNAMNESTRMLRAGTDNPVQGQSLNDPAFVSATNETVVLYAYVNLTGSTQKPIMVRLSVDPTTRRLIETIWPATDLGNGYWSFPAVTSTPSNVRTLAQVVSPHASGAPWTFTYLDANNNAIATSSGTLATGAVAATSLATIAAVQVTLTIQPSLINATHPVTLQNTVGLPNLGLNRITS
jgi:type II secretory pathway pseudopilin PulG